jgi:hypothetical protein
MAQKFGWEFQQEGMKPMKDMKGRPFSAETEQRVSFQEGSAGKSNRKT